MKRKLIKFLAEEKKDLLYIKRRGDLTREGFGMLLFIRMIEEVVLRRELKI
jgi:hypothetical protein